MAKTDDQAAKKTKAQGAKPRKPPPRGVRSRAVKDPEEQSDRYVAGTAVGDQASSHQIAVRKAQKLKALIEPKTAQLIDAMFDIALNRDHERDPNKYPSIHASIRLEAADRLLSRAYGKPKEHIEIEDHSAGGTESDEVTKLLNNILEKVGAPLLDAPGTTPQAPSAPSEE